MSANRRSVTIMSSTGAEMNQYSTEAQADSYFGYTDGLHTIQCTYEEFEGNVHIQGTLDLSPEAGDWFDINPQTVHGTAFITDTNGTFSPHANTSASEAYTFTGNFAYVRVYMNRTNVGDGANYVSTYGQITRTLLSS